MTTPEKCVAAPHNIPVQLVRNSPLFTPADIRFGDTVLKNSQYIDAHQRATFWKTTNFDKNGYHLGLAPNYLPPLEINVPIDRGVAVDSQAVLGNLNCGTIAQVDLNWFDNYLRTVALPKLAAKGLVNPTKTPVFLAKNLGLSFDASTLSIFALGYHDVMLSGIGVATTLQTYMVSGVGMGALSSAPDDVLVLSHELGEWVNDPFINNMSPPVGFGGGFCSPVPTEIGDFLRGGVATKVSADGYTYHLQEMAFLPWFFGGASPSINGWYSANGTFTTPLLKAPCL